MSIEETYLILEACWRQECLFCGADCESVYYLMSGLHTHFAQQKMWGM